jgi:phage-related holin
MYWKKEFNTLSKQIVSIQILWTLATIILILASSFLKNILTFSNQLTALTILFSLVVNLYIILRNTSEIEKIEKLHIKLNFSFI